MKKAGWCFFLLMAMARLGVAQVPTIDNFTLEKYQKQRIAAQRDYQENYARMGFPSPEELDRQRDADMTARLTLANELRQARLEEQRIDVQRRGLDIQAASIENEREAREAMYAGYYGNQGSGYSEGYGYGGYYPSGYGYGAGAANYGRFGYGRFGRFGNNGYRSNGIWGVPGGYRATPVGVYQHYTGVPRPLVRRPGGYVRHY